MISLTEICRLRQINFAKTWVFRINCFILRKKGRRRDDIIVGMCHNENDFFFFFKKVTKSLTCSKQVATRFEGKVFLQDRSSRGHDRSVSKQQSDPTVDPFWWIPDQIQEGVHGGHSLLFTTRGRWGAAERFPWLDQDHDHYTSDDSHDGSCCVIAKSPEAYSPRRSWFDRWQACKVAAYHLYLKS